MSKNHIHKIMRSQLGSGRRIVYNPDGSRSLIKGVGYEVFRCVLPDCGFYKTREMVIGTTSYCWVCGDTLVLNQENTMRKRPTHKWCRQSKSSESEVA